MNAFQHIPDFSVPPKDLIRHSQAARQTPAAQSPNSALVAVLERATAAKTLEESQAAAREALRLVGGAV